MSDSTPATRRFRIERLEERIAPACLFWDGTPDEASAESGVARGASASTGLEPVRASGLSAESPLVRGLQGSALAHIGATRSDRGNQYRAPLAPHEVTELLDDIDRRFNQPLPKNPLDLLEELDQTYNQPLPRNTGALLEELDHRYNQPGRPLPQYRGAGVS